MSYQYSGDVFLELAAQGVLEELGGEDHQLINSINSV